jgi:hypothetical protein
VWAVPPPPPSTCFDKGAWSCPSEIKNPTAAASKSVGGGLSRSYTCLDLVERVVEGEVPTQYKATQLVVALAVWAT